MQGSQQTSRISYLGPEENVRVEEALKCEALKATEGRFGCQHEVGLGFSATTDYRISPSNAPAPTEAMGALTPMSSTQPPSQHCYPWAALRAEVDLCLGQRRPKQPLAKSQGLKGCKSTEATGLRARTCKVACRKAAPWYRTPCKFSTHVWILCLNKNQP